MVELFGNSGEPDQMPHSAASDLGLHCLPVILLGVSRLHWVNKYCNKIRNALIFFLQFCVASCCVDQEADSSV